MNSHEALQKAVEKLGAKHVADALGVSLSLVYKWCEPEEKSGAANPLDRMEALLAATGENSLIHWLCERHGGVFVERPSAPVQKDLQLVGETQRMLKEFSDVLQVVSSAFVDGKMTREEAERIRREWNEMHRIAESLVRTCEELAAHPRRTAAR